jgi:NTP pyrophosphatase (non-canonical NTP hydrolase)
MNKLVVLIMCLSVVIGAASCKRTLLPDNAAQLIEKIEALSKESAGSSDKIDVNSQKEKLGDLLAESKKIGDALPGPLRKIFMDKIQSLTEKINTK